MCMNVPMLSSSGLWIEEDMTSSTLSLVLVEATGGSSSLLGLIGHGDGLRDSQLPGNMVEESKWLAASGVFVSLDLIEAPDSIV